MNDESRQIRQEEAGSRNRNRGVGPLRGLPLLAFLPAVLCFFLYRIFVCGLPVTASEMTTQEKLDAAKEAASQTQDAIDDSDRRREELVEAQAALQGELYSLNQKLGSVAQEISSLDDQIQKKQDEITTISEDLESVQAEIAGVREEIAQAKADLDATEAELAESYELMKEHVRFLYERGSVYYLEIILDSRNLSDFLNRRRYIELLSAYDSRVMEEYREKAKELAEKKKALEEKEEALTRKEEEVRLARDELKQAKSSLQGMYSSQAARHGELSGLVTQTAGSISMTQEQQAQVEQSTETLKAQLEEQNAQIEELQRQLEEEKRLQALSDALAWRDLSQVAVEDSDLYLLANLIYCEAGGEPYEGQVAVGAVVMNRVMSGAFPNTISEVVYQKWQFTPAMTGRLALALSRDDATPSCYQAASAALAGQSPVGDCLFFRTPIPEVDPKYVIGGHVFY